MMIVDAQDIGALVVIMLIATLLLLAGAVSWSTPSETLKAARGDRGHDPMAEAV